MGWQCGDSANTQSKPGLAMCGRPGNAQYKQTPFSEQRNERQTNNQAPHLYSTCLAGAVRWSQEGKLHSASRWRCHSQAKLNIYCSQSHSSTTVSTTASWVSGLNHTSNDKWLMDGCEQSHMATQHLMASAVASGPLPARIPTAGCDPEPRPQGTALVNARHLTQLGSSPKGCGVGRTVSVMGLSCCLTAHHGALGSASDGV